MISAVTICAFGQAVAYRLFSQKSYIVVPKSTTSDDMNRLTSLCSLHGVGTSARKAGRFYPRDLRRRYEVNQWVIWQTANQGPKLGECGHFRHLGDKQGDQSYAVRRFTDEANRLYGVLNNRLYDRRYIAGDDYTIADMISYPWT